MPGPTSLPPAYVFDSDDTAGAVNHGSVLHVVDRDEIRALWTKLGLGASVPADGQVLRGTGAGTSGFGALAAGDIADGLITSAKIADGTIVNADVNASAALALSKLAAGASGLLKSNGTTISAGNQLAAGDVPTGLITSGMISDGTIATGDLAANAATQVWSMAAGGSTTAVIPAWGTLAALPITSTGSGSIRIEAALVASLAPGSPDLGYLGYNVDGGSDVQIAVHYFPTGNYTMLYATVTIGVLTGAHTINLRGAAPSAGKTLNTFSGSLFIATEFKR